jgi:predicted RNase H-like HicB family nuclease
VTPRMADPINLTIVYEPAEEGGYVAWIQEVPGAISQGETREEARENVLDALRELALSFMHDGDPPRNAERETVGVSVA